MPLPVIFGTEIPYDLDLEVVNKRTQSIQEGLEDAVEAFSKSMVQGWVFKVGIDFPNGEVLASFVESVVLGNIACLMEAGFLPKRLPKKGKTVSEDDKPVPGYA